MIEFACPSCASPFRVPDEAVGRRGKCNKCGHVVTVPRPLETVEKRPVASVPQPLVASSPSRPFVDSSTSPQINSVGSQIGQAVYAETKNTIGMRGLAVSLVGTLLTCGVLSPFGLIISIVGCFAKPRGAAITGTIVGAIGSAWLFTAGLSMVLTFFSVQQSIVGTAKSVEGAAGAAHKIAKDGSEYIANPDKLADDAKRVIDKTKAEVDRAIGTSPEK